MNGSAFGDGRRSEIARRLEIIFVARGEMNRLRYLIETRNIYRRLAKRARDAADQSSLQSSEASVTASLAEIRAYEAELFAARQSTANGTPRGRSLSLFGVVWTSPKRRAAEAAMAARDVAVATSLDAGRQRDQHQTDAREREEEAVFLAASVVRAEEALRPWSHRYEPERALSIHETAMLSAIAQMSDEELDVALRYGNLTPSQYRELMVLTGRDDMVRRIDAGDIPAALTSPPEEIEVPDIEFEPEPDPVEIADEEIALVAEETEIVGPAVEPEQDKEAAAATPLEQDNDQALKLVADPG